MKRKSVGLLIGVIIVLSGFAYLVTGGIGENLVYFYTPGELLAKGASAYDQPVKLGGQVAPQSVQWNAEALDLRFILQDADGQIQVHARKAPPQMFREGMGVVVEGRLTRSGVFESHNLMIKHSNEYRPPEEGHDPAKLYRSLITES